MNPPNLEVRSDLDYEDQRLKSIIVDKKKAARISVHQPNDFHQRKVIEYRSFNEESGASHRHNDTIERNTIKIDYNEICIDELKAHKRNENEFIII